MEEKGTILLAEDAESSLLILDKMLRDAGYKVVPARNGKEVVSLAESGAIDLVLLDVMMPELDGYGALKVLRERFTLTQLPVIMLTGRNDSNSVIEALRLGANDYAVKPAEPGVLLERIATHLKLKRPQTQRVGNYELNRQLGTGAMGLVYAATDVATKQEVAIKILPRSLTVQLAGVQRFLREATLLGRIHHPHVVRFLNAGHDQETYYLVMELVKGSTLAEVARDKPMAVADALDVCRQVALGLNELSKHGIVHRDLKPANLLLTADTHMIKIADFGVARDLQGEGMRSQSGLVVGSLVFSSWEQINGESNEQSDMYSLGCTLFFLITGKLPFPANRTAVWYAEEKQKRPPSVSEVRADVPKDVVRFVGRLMEPRPAKRFHSYADLLNAVDSLSRGKTLPT